MVPHGGPWELFVECGVPVELCLYGEGACEACVENVIDVFSSFVGQSWQFSGVVT